MSEPRLVEVRKNVLKQNDVVARSLRERFRSAGVFVVSLVSSPGSGKTAFLEKTLTTLRSNYRVAALVGDLATENDAVRLARSQAPVKQIITGTICHLEAAMVEKSLADWDLNLSIFFSSRTSATWFVLPRTTSGKTSVSFSCRSLKERTSRSNIRPSSIAQTSRSLPRWIWPRQWNSTRRRRAPTSRPCGRECACFNCRPNPAKACAITSIFL